MIAFAFINAEGIPTGGGIGPSLPEGAIPLNDPFTTADVPRLEWRNGTWIERDLPEPTPPTQTEIEAQAASFLEQARAQAIERINDRVGWVRKQIYTDIPGQDALYLEKRAEAVAYVAETNLGGEPETLKDYPLLNNEVGITAPTAWSLAQIWLNRSDQFKRVGALTERARMQAAIAVSTAPDFQTIEKIEATFTEALSSLSL